MKNELFAQIGVSVDTPGFVALAQHLGFNLEVDLEPIEGEASTYLEQPEQGLALAITDSSTLRSWSGPELPLGLNPLVFSNVFLYLTPVDEYRPYEGKLPLGLKPRSLAVSFSSNWGCQIGSVSTRREILSHRNGSWMRSANCMQLTYLMVKGYPFSAWGWLAVSS